MAMTVVWSSPKHAGGITLANATPRPVQAKNPPVSGTRQRSFTEEEIKKADAEIIRAFAILGLVSKEGTLVCPVCGTSKRKKVELKTSTSSGKHYWTCHKCPESWGGSAIDLLKEHGGRSFVQAVEELLGLTESEKGRVTLPKIDISEAFSAVVDVEVYDAVRDAGSLEKAQEYYARWHISPQAVLDAGSTMIEDPEALHRKLIERFGLPVFLFNRDYPVVEVHQAPSGHVVGMQFRPSPARMQAVQAHKAWKKRWSGITDADGKDIEADDAWRQAYEKDQSVGRKAPYVTPFLSLKGGSPDHLVGCGLKRLVEIERPSTIYVVEGFKDLLAARTIGVEAYAIPGTGVMPPERSIEILRLHKVIVMLDGDAAGAAGRDHLVTYLKERGVDADPIDSIREGLDVADILVERNAHAGCVCDTCSSWRDSHPFDPQTCPCKTCRASRGGPQV
jgi:5S rRNA maturation endonuclease (ribonuclease M5)